MAARRQLSPLFTWRSALSSPASPLTATQRHVALTLSLHMSERGDSCWPSMETLEGESGRALSTVRDSLKAMAEIGWLERELASGRGRSNNYRAVIPAYFDPDETGEENRRRAVAFAADGTGALATAALERDPDGDLDDQPETTGHRWDSGQGGERENHRTRSVKPPVESAKPTGDRHQGRQEDVSEDETRANALVPAAAGEWDERRFEIELALSAALNLKPDQMTRRERGAWELAISQLAEVAATGEQVSSRCTAYRRMWPTMRLTPLALVRHWSLLGLEVETGTADDPVAAWVEKAPTIFDRQTAHELLDDRAGVNDNAREQHHARLDELYDERARQAA